MNKTFRYQVIGYSSVWTTRRFKSKKALRNAFSFDSGVFKVFKNKQARKRDFVFIEEV